MWATCGSGTYHTSYRGLELGHVTGCDPPQGLGNHQISSSCVPGKIRKWVWETTLVIYYVIDI